MEGGAPHPAAREAMALGRPPSTSRRRSRRSAAQRHQHDGHEQRRRADEHAADDHGKVEVDAGVTLGSPRHPPERGRRDQHAQRRTEPTAEDRGEGVGEAEVGEEAPRARPSALEGLALAEPIGDGADEGEDDRGAADEGQHEGHDPQPGGHRVEGGSGLPPQGVRAEERLELDRVLRLDPRPELAERCAGLGGDQRADREQPDLVAVGRRERRGEEVEVDVVLPADHVAGARRMPTTSSDQLATPSEGDEPERPSGRS